MSNDIESALSAMGYEVTSGEVPEGTPLDAPTFSAPEGAEVLDFSDQIAEPTPEQPEDAPQEAPEPEQQLEQEPAQSSFTNEPEPEMSEQEFELQSQATSVKS
jgi:hypothetical protein